MRTHLPRPNGIVRGEREHHCRRATESTTEAREMSTGDNRKDIRGRVEDRSRRLLAERKESPTAAVMARYKEIDGGTQGPRDQRSGPASCLRIRFSTSSGTKSRIEHASNSAYTCRTTSFISSG